MELDKTMVYQLLIDHNIHYLYHANTVTTACTFIEQGGLLSRGYVDEQGLIQTFQDSDGEDKQFGVWYDIFLDTVDLHQWFGRDNHYGPVLFKFKSDILLHPELPPLWITKDNPIYWNNEMSDTDRYIQDVQELNKVLETLSHAERQKKMFTLRFANEQLSFDDNLDEIIIDNPNLEIDKVNIFEESVNKLRECIEKNNQEWIKEKFTVRECNNCYCRHNYLTERSVPELQKRFL